MNFNEYQEKARGTAIYSNKVKVLYPALGLPGETGEVCEKIKKVYRDNDGIFTPEKVNEIKKELGDVLWYVANLSADLNISMQEVAEMNIDKLNSRKERGVLQGSGDNR
jgi:NTP pyrophosphatase (non-canonical NTP hydrolase)